MNPLHDAVTPNKLVLQAMYVWYALFWCVLIIGIWTVWPSAMLPKFPEVLASFSIIWKQGIIIELARSFWMNIVALCWTLMISLTLSYLSVLPFFRPLVEGVAKLRFLGMTGLTLPFAIAFGGGMHLKISILVFGMTSYFVTAMAQEVAIIPEAKFNHLRTLRYSEWRIVWEAVILGTADKALEVTRQIAGMGWMMTSMVEAIVMSGGGIGMVLILRSKQYDKLPEIFATLILMVIVGILLDKGLRAVARAAFPWAQVSGGR